MPNKKETLTPEIKNKLKFLIYKNEFDSVENIISELKDKNPKDSKVDRIRISLISLKQFIKRPPNDEKVYEKFFNFKKIQLVNLLNDKKIPHEEAMKMLGFKERHLEGYDLYMSEASKYRSLGEVIVAPGNMVTGVGLNKNFELETYNLPSGTENKQKLFFLWREINRGEIVLDEKALRKFKKIVKKCEAEFKKALEYYQKAEGECKKAIEVKPDAGSPYKLIARIKQRTGQYEEAIKYYEIATRNSPQLRAQCKQYIDECKKKLSKKPIL